MGHRFESCRGNNDFVAQLVELLTFNQKAVGSSPTGITKLQVRLR